MVFGAFKINGRMGFVAAMSIYGAVFLNGCASMNPTGTARIVEAPYKFVYPSAVGADLEVSDTRVSGKANCYTRSSSPKQQEVDAFKNAATIDALRKIGGGDISKMADILVEPIYIFEYDKYNYLTSVSVTGYPAKFKNFRQLEVDLSGQTAGCAENQNKKSPMIFKKGAKE